ncbi:hypothetical protein [uncultured Paracoccus sp.]|uniref:hypothetical protein n=1 Tax=uncultured Paracoccus sp. TaxID=189685 RepID=UPI00262263E3|nr:hypothetical protein [uncultured Paracoccus sp.]
MDGLDNVNSAWRMLQASSWGKITNWAELMTTIDAPARDHDNFLLEQGAPHDDALAVGAAVADLAHCEIVIPSGWDPLPDWPQHDDRMPGLMAQAIERAVERFTLRPRGRRAAHLVSLVIGSAVLGREPGWAAPVPAIRMVERAGRPAWFMAKQVRDVFGRANEIEVDGFNRKAGRPYRGAYRKYEFSDDPVADIMARLDRELWAAALRRVHDRVANQLVSHRLSESEIVARPWGERGPRVQLIAGPGIGAKRTA